MESGLSRSTSRGTFGQNRSGESGSRERKMERLGLFWFQSLQFFLLAKLASDVAERDLRSLRIRIEACRRILCGRGRAIVFLRALVSLGLNLRAVFWSEDVGMFEIFFGVNMLGALL